MVTVIQSTHKKERGPHLEKGADHGLSQFLDAEKRSTTACQFEHALRDKIVGQDEAVQALVDICQVFCDGLHSPGAAGNLLFLGPTGSGKTRTVEAAAIERYVVYPIARLLATAQLHQGDALVIDHHLGEQGLLFLRDMENRSSDLPLPKSGQLMTAEARV